MKRAALIVVIACSNRSTEPAREIPQGSGSPPAIDASVARAVDAATSDQPKVKAKRKGAGTPDASGWYPATSESGGFSVLLPAPFNEFDIEAKSDVTGAPTTTYSLGTERPTDKVKFAVACTVGDGRKPLELVKAFPEKLGAQSHRELEVAGHPAVELKVEGAAGNAMMQAVALPDRVCLLIVDTQDKATPLPERDAVRMFRSFKLGAS